jgi:hypothetical protein
MNKNMQDERLELRQVHLVLGKLYMSSGTYV